MIEDSYDLVVGGFPGASAGAGLAPGISYR